MATVPDKKTNEVTLDQWNQQFRASPERAEFLQLIGVDPNGPIRLSDSQREQFKKFLATKGIQIPSGMEIDPAGNLNQNEGVGKYATNPWVLGGLAAGSMLIPGVGPAVLGGLKSAGSGIASGLGKAGSAIGGGVAKAATGKGAGGLFGSIAGLAGEVLGAGANTMAHNRGQLMDAQQAEALFNLQQDRQYRDQLADRERIGMETGNNALQNVQRSEYIANNQGYTPSTFTSVGKTRRLPSYGFGPTQSTEAEKAGAAGMRGEALQRLQQGNPIPEVQAPTPFVFENKEPGLFENIAQWTAPGLTLWDQITRGGYRKLLEDDEDETAYGGDWIE